MPMARNHQSKVISALFVKGQPMAFGAGDVIMGNHDTPDGVYFINSGFVKIYSISNEGDEYMHIVYGHGEIFPLAWAYLGAGERSLFYEAISDVVVWRISREAFIQKINSDIELSNAMGEQLARQFKIFNVRIDNLEYKKADERIAYRLLFLASRFGIKDKDSVIIEAPITHTIFANSINLVRESVSREIEKLTKKGIIKKVNNHIIITNIAALEAKISNPIDLDF
jgi:CRP/FNR family cyclic AMP-dependent transcriptional regulator